MADTKLTSGAVLFRRKNGKTFWFLAKTQESDSWEIPKGVVRRGESSVRTAIRTVDEEANIAARVLEEAGRAGEVIYYLMQQLGSFGGKPRYAQVLWNSYALAKQRLGSASERRIITQANQVLREWLKKNA